MRPIASRHAPAILVVVGLAAPLAHASPRPLVPDLAPSPPASAATARATLPKVRAPKVGELALVDRAARMHPSAAAAKAAPATKRRPVDPVWGASAPMIVRVRAVDADTVAVTNLTDRAGHCYAEPDETLDGHRVDGVVRREDLLPVLQTTKTLDHADGTRATFASGVAIGAFAGGEPAAFVGQVALAVPLTEAEVGASYPRPPTPLLPPAPYDRFVRGKARFIGHDAPVVLLGAARYRGSELGDVLQYVRSEVGDHLSVGSTCVALRVVAGAIDDAPPGGGAALGGARERVRAVAAGSPVFWADGGRAGTVTVPRRIRGDLRTKGARECFDARPIADELCYDASSLVEVK